MVKRGQETKYCPLEYIKRYICSLWRPLSSAFPSQVPPCPRTAPKHLPCAQSTLSDAGLSRLTRSRLFAFTSLLYCISNLGLAWNRHIHMKNALWFCFSRTTSHSIPHHFTVAKSIPDRAYLVPSPLSKGSL